MSTDRLGGWLRHWLPTLRRHVWKPDDGTRVSAAVEPSFGAVRLQLTVGEQWL